MIYSLFVLKHKPLHGSYTVDMLLCTKYKMVIGFDPELLGNNTIMNTHSMKSKISLKCLC